jgi:D-alanine-D-alanine ligase-like ATP-grasp enzyme
MDTAKQASLESIDMLRPHFIARGFTCQEIDLKGRRFERFTNDDGWMWLTPQKTVSYPFVTFAAARLSALKDLTYALAEQAGLVIPATLLTSEATPQQIAAFLERYAPIVVKPLQSHASIGLTLNVTTPEALQSALRLAENEKGILLQQQFKGEEIRVTVFRGRVVSAILRQTARVIGDGTSTIEELIAVENEARKTLVFEWLSYPQLDETLVQPGLLHSQSVPAEDEIIELNKVTMASGGASFYNVTDELHNSYKEAVLRFAATVNPEFMAVDIMATDYTQPLSADNYVFIETNTSPSLKLYYSVRDRKVYDIIPELVDGIIIQRSALYQ